MIQDLCFRSVRILLLVFSFSVNQTSKVKKAGGRTVPVDWSISLDFCGKFRVLS